jgi:hypothetical protein
MSVRRSAVVYVKWWKQYAPLAPGLWAPVSRLAGPGVDPSAPGKTPWGARPCWWRASHSNSTANRIRFTSVLGCLTVSIGPGGTLRVAALPSLGQGSTQGSVDVLLEPRKTYLL